MFHSLGYISFHSYICVHFLWLHFYCSFFSSQLQNFIVYTIHHSNIWASWVKSIVLNKCKIITSLFEAQWVTFFTCLIKCLIEFHHYHLCSFWLQMCVSLDIDFTNCLHRYILLLWNFVETTQVLFGLQLHVL
jgi:hypothetical protein